MLNKKSRCVSCGIEKEGIYQSLDWLCPDCAKGKGQELRTTREEAGLTLIEAAHVLGVSVPRLREIEGGHIRKLGNFKKLKLALDKYSKQKELVFDVFRVPPTANRYNRMYWAERHQLKKEWLEEIKYAILENLHGVLKGSFQSPQISVEIYFKHKPRRDKMNNYLTVDKLIIDSLVELGILQDDKDIVPTITMHKGAREKTRIRIKEGAYENRTNSA